MEEPRLSFPEMSCPWRAGSKQRLLNSDYVLYDPVKQVEDKPTNVECELMSNQTFLFGPNTKFHFKLLIQDNAISPHMKIIEWNYIKSKKFVLMVGTYLYKKAKPKQYSF